MCGEQLPSRSVTVQLVTLSDYFFSGSLDPWFVGETQERQDNQALQERFVQAARTTRLGRPAGLAGISAFLLSDEAEWINGQVWYIGGGAHLRQ
jgi:NAD(P)-dependent dehydrogenase (short-subunit alcohol dehydrogenase family)